MPCFNCGLIWELICGVHVCLNQSCPATHHNWATWAAQTTYINKSHKNSSIAKKCTILARTPAQSKFRFDFQWKRWYTLNVVSQNSSTMRLTMLCLSSCCGLLHQTRSGSPNHIYNVILPKLKQMERESCGTACVVLSLQFSNGCNYFELQSALCTLHQIKSGQRGNGIKPHATGKQP